MNPYRCALCVSLGSLALCPHMAELRPKETHTPTAHEWTIPATKAPVVVSSTSTTSRDILAVAGRYGLQTVRIISPANHITVITTSRRSV